jgi:hypothetical protein
MEVATIRTVEILAAALTPLLAIVAAYIAYQQYRTARHKLRLELYDRRFKVYSAVTACLRGIASAKNLPPEELNELITSLHAQAAEAAFLFGPEVRQFIGEISVKAARLSVVRPLSTAPMARESESMRASDEIGDILDWIVQRIQTAESVFVPYLSFKWLK